VIAATGLDKAGLLLPDDLRVLAGGLLDHPECVAWCPLACCVYCGGEGGQIYRVDLDTGAADQITQIDGGFICGVAVDGVGAVIACDVANGRVWRVLPSGDVAQYGDPIAYPNYPLLDADGVLWVSDSGSYDQADGGVVRIAPDGSTRQLALRGLRFANGMALRDGQLYVIESQGPSIVRLELPDASDVQQVVVLPGTVPDGLAFDAEGGLWISCYQPNRVYRVSPDGVLDLVVDDWSGWHLTMPTNLAFAGPALDQLVLANLGGRHLATFRPGVRGAPLERPVLA
jgi:sugar lactone lactonase YvrE